MLELIGRYRIHEQIGEGAMADVYRAHDPHIDRALAIKVLKPEYREDREYAARFLREARAAGALSHPGIVTVFDVGEVDGYPFIVMELLDGEPLSEVLKRGAMRPSEVINIGVQLADALAYAHAQGVIHRDIKPSNIILSPDGKTLKLLDFGIAQLAENDPLFDEASYRTQIGQVIGTPRYMSPEQALGQEMDARSDIYSVGIVLYEMLSGRRAFPGASAATLTAQIVNTDPTPLSEVAPDTPRGLQFIVHKAMAKQPAQRFSDAGRVSEALRRELSVAEAVAKEAAAQRSYLPLQVRLTLLLALVTALVLAVAVGTVLIKQRDAMRQVALTSGNAVSAFVANNAALRAVDNAALPPEQQDWVPVQAFVKSASADPNLRGLTVVDAGGLVRASSNPDLVGTPYKAAQNEGLVGNDEGVAISSAEGGRSFRFVRPILYAGRSFGKVDVLLDQTKLRSAAWVSTWLLMLLALVTLGTVALGTFLSARLLQAPIVRLRGALLEIARGNLDFRLSHRRRDEFGELFDDVNLVAQTTQERLNAVEAMLLDRPSPPAADKPASSERHEDASSGVAIVDNETNQAKASAAGPFLLGGGHEPVEPVAQSQELELPKVSDNTAPSQAPDYADAPASVIASPPPTPGAVEAEPAPAATEPSPQAEPASEPVAAPKEVHQAEEIDASATAPASAASVPADETEREPEPEPSSPGYLSPPWPHDEDEDRTLMDPEDQRFR